ncbi:MAG: aminotransferase class V-fold PLP-dependent enzyme [Chthoniobacterales bacterium]
MIADLEADEDLRRREFPICARKIYCAHAADAPLPRRVADAMRASIERAATDERQFDQELASIAETRTAVARLLGAQREEISFTGPTSSGLNTIANGLDWEAGDEVVCYLDDYPANVYPWLALQRHGVKVVLLETKRVGEITPEIVERALTKRTKLVALASANYISGYQIDAGAIGALCLERDVLFSLDAIQTLGAFPIELDNVDFLSAGAQKWILGPSGAGVLFVKKNRHDALRPQAIGGWNVESPNFIAQREIIYAADGQKFEPGAYNHSAIAGLRAAVELLLEISQAKISERILTLTTMLREHIAEFEFLGSAEKKNRAGILTFRHRRLATEKLARALRENGVVISLRFDRAGESWLRVSPHFYNTPAEMERTAEILNREAGV